jgi:hypothetical protein
MKQAFWLVASSALLATAFGFQAKADLVLGGPDSTDGSYSTARLAATANPGDTKSAAGFTGISVWGLLGGATPASGSPGVYGAITTAPGGSNPKNTILRYYLVATGGSGQQSVVSLGEIDPTFGNGPSVNAFVAYRNTGGSELATPSLIVPGQPGRDVTDVTSLQILSVPAPSGPGGVSTAVQLSGNVSSPGSYNLTQLEALTPTAKLTVGTDIYTGVPLWAFLNPTSSSSTNQIVVTQGTDGYEVVLALAELDPSLGGNPDDLLPYEDTANTFGSAGIARTIFPTDAAHGRWESNLEFVTVEDAPEPGSLTLLGVALAAMGTLRGRLFRRRGGWTEAD